MNNKQKITALKAMNSLPNNMKRIILNKLKPPIGETISAGGFHSLGLKADGSVVGWGDNKYGQATNQKGPFIAISAGKYHSLGLQPDGSVVGWGDNKNGRATNQTGPFRVPTKTHKIINKSIQNNKSNKTTKKVVSSLRPPSINQLNKYTLEGNLAKMKGILAVNRENGNINMIVSKLKSIINRTNIPKNKLNIIFDNRYNVDKEVF